MTRGRILRDTNSGPGIIVIDGNQKTFSLESHWKSSVPPKIGAIVDVELSAEGNVLAVEVVSESIIIKEQAIKAAELASDQSKKIAAIANSHGKVYAGAILEKVGGTKLIVLATLGISWLFLATLNIQLSSSTNANISFFDILKIANNSLGLEGFRAVDNLGSGFYGFLMFAVLVAPIASHFHENKYLKLSYCLPLIFMLIVGLNIYFSIKSSVATMSDAASIFGGGQGGAMAKKMMDTMLDMAMKAVSLGIGAYISIAAATYLFILGIKKFLLETA